MISEDIGLSFNSLFQTIFHGGSGLSFQRKFYPAGSEDFIGSVKEGEHPSDSQIIHCLINDFLYHDGSEPCIKSTGHFETEFIDSLTSQKRGDDGHVAGNLIKLLAFFIDDFIKSKMFKAFHKFRISFIIVFHYRFPPVFLAISVWNKNHHLRLPAIRWRFRYLELPGQYERTNCRLWRRASVLLPEE